jgi:hypothetical protein
MAAVCVWWLPETAGSFLDNLSISSVNERTIRRDSIRENVTAIHALTTPALLERKMTFAPSFREFIRNESRGEHVNDTDDEEDEEPLMINPWIDI